MCAANNKCQEHVYLSADEIKFIQRVLKENGYYSGSDTGSFDAATQAAFDGATAGMPLIDEVERRQNTKLAVIAGMSAKFEYDRINSTEGNYESSQERLLVGTFRFTQREPAPYSYIVDTREYSFFSDGKCQRKDVFDNTTNPAVREEAILLGRCEIVHEKKKTDVLLLWAQASSGKDWEVDQHNAVAIYMGNRGFPWYETYGVFGENVLLGSTLYERVSK
jgi:hypothetical protein